MIPFEASHQNRVIGNLFKNFGYSPLGGESFWQDCSYPSGLMLFTICRESRDKFPLSVMVNQIIFPTTVSSFLRSAKTHIEYINLLVVV